MSGAQTPDGLPEGKLVWVPGVGWEPAVTEPAIERVVCPPTRPIDPFPFPPYRPRGCGHGLLCSCCCHGCCGFGCRCRHWPTYSTIGPVWTSAGTNTNEITFGTARLG